MKIRVVYFLLFLGIIGCKQSPEKQVVVEEQIVDLKAQYPAAMWKILEAHGGLAVWQEQQLLSYELVKNSGTEKHSIDLYSRKDRIETESYQMGFDGKDVWLLDPDGNYKGDPVFYHNLMFYFYAMPFVLADDGIEYYETDDLTYEGKDYPGLGIRYDDGVGTSPEDEYFIHYDPETNQMAWLGYTVTYRTGEKSEDVHWIRYDNWTTINGVILPKSISWYNIEEGELSTLRNTVDFENIQLSKGPADPSMYNKPGAAEIRLAISHEDK